MSGIGAWRDGAPVTPGRSGESLAIPLTAQNRWVQVTGTVPLELISKGELPLALPALSAPVATVEVRAVLPSSRRYALADPKRAGQVGPPPQDRAPATRPASSNYIASQIGAFRPFKVGRAPGLFSSPAGYAEFEMSWSALSTKPGAVVLEVETRKEGASWF